VVRKLADIASKGGNFLLNVGPTAEGVIPEPSVRILETAGRWVRAHGEAIYGTTFAPPSLAQPPWGRITRKSVSGADRLYLIIFDRPREAGQSLFLPGLRRRAIQRATLLKNRRQVVTIAARTDDSGIEVFLPPAEIAAPTPFATVVTLEMADGIIPPPAPQ
jgi:alpha-L-fucosidase